MEKPLISIIIPVFNTSTFLPDCLDSIIEQSYKNLEIICVDDGSTDNSVNIITKYMSLDSRIRLIQQKNSGQSVARNKALEEAKGEYISFVDSDDLLDKYTLERTLKILIKKNVDAVLYNMEMFLPNGESFICFSGPLYPKENGLLNVDDNECCINITNAAPAVFRRSSIRFKFPEGMIYEDWVFMVKFFTHETKIYWMNTPFYKYRRDFKKSTTSNTTLKCLDLFKAYELSREILIDHNLEHKFAFINDFKILNEGIGFLEARLLQSSFNEVMGEFIKKLMDIVSSFPDAYYYSLLTFMEENRKNLLNILRTSRYKGNINERESWILFKKLKIARKKVLFKISIKKGIKKSSMKIKKCIKKVIFSISLVYRMSYYNNALILEILWKNESEINKLNAQINRLEKQQRKLNKIYKNKI